MRSSLFLVPFALFVACDRSPGSMPQLAGPEPAAAAGSPGAGPSQSGLPGPSVASDPALAPSAPKLLSFQVRDPAGSSGPVKLANLPHLVIASAYTAAPGPHGQLVEVTDPHGALYGKVRSQVQAAADGTVKASQKLEVSGTTIETYHMVGTWQFVLMVDGVPLASTSADIVE